MGSPVVRPVLPFFIEETDALIEIIGIHKHYGATKANDDVSLTILDGSVHAILGENGAGKSTLMKILAGYVPKTSGDIRMDGKVVDISSPVAASKLGIGMLYQDPMDFPQLSVIDNFMIGQVKGFRLNKTAYLDQFKRLCQRLGFSLNPLDLVKTLTVGERQQLEIIRLLSIGVRVLILDEPTTGISTDQKDTLFRALNRLTDEGKSVILVSHKLEDVDALCHRITVLRQGKVSGHMERPFDSQALLDMMFETRSTPPVRLEFDQGPLTLSFDNVSAKGGRVGLNRVSVRLFEKEIVGLAGLEGSGQGVFLRAAAGLTPITEGDATLDGVSLKGKSHVFYQQSGVFFLPSSRLEEGLIPGMNLMQHYALGLRPKPFIVKRKEAYSMANESIDTFRIKARPDSTVETLSGGNQQRLLLSLLPHSPRLLLLENPTRGLDVDSAHTIWKHLQSYCHTHRTTLVFTSNEIDEIMMVSDRILVFYDGVLVMDKQTGETSLPEIGAAIAGKTSTD